MGKKFEHISGIPSGMPSRRPDRSRPEPERGGDDAEVRAQQAVDQAFASIPTTTPGKPLTDAEMQAMFAAHQGREDQTQRVAEQGFRRRLSAEGKGLTPEQMRAALEAHNAQRRDQEPDAHRARYLQDLDETGHEVQGNILLKVHRIFDHPKFRRTEMSVANEQILRLIESFARGEDQSDQALVRFLETQRISWEGRNGEALSTTLWNILSWNANHNTDEEVRREAAQIMDVLNNIKGKRRTA